MTAIRRRDASRAFLAVAVVGLALGGVLWAAGEHDTANMAWAATTIVGILPLAYSVAIDLLHRETGVDVIALLAMAGALALGEYLAGAVIALMLSSGRSLEAFADARAHRELSSLLERAPRTVHRYAGDELESIPIGEVRPADVVLVKHGEVVPVDGFLVSENCVLDESALTGESRPVERSKGEALRSGAVNAGASLALRATTTAEESTYAGIVRLIKEAEKQKAPFVRLADRYALVFVPVSLAIAAGAWVLTGDPVRALAVLVVATPCPLILAVPIAIVAGISRAARRGIIVKGGGALETLARGSVLLFDKTGTLTSGVPEVADVEVFASIDPEELLRLAASLDQLSPHVLGAAIVRAARQRGLQLSFPVDVREEPGSGIEGTVDGRRVSLGKASWVSGGRGLPARARDIRRRSAMEGSSAVFVAIDGEVTGGLILDDPIRPDTPRVIRTLRRAGIKRVVMVTGDHPDVAESVGISIGVDRILSERDPTDKVDAVKAAGDVGVAMGARGATASSEAADVVLVVDRLDRLAEAIRVAKRSRGIAVQSVLIGMGLSFGGMVLGAVGLLPVVGGALFQEAIDVAVILNALRALSGGRAARQRAGLGSNVGDRFRDEHREFVPWLARIRTVADRLESYSPVEARDELQQIRWFLTERLPQHEEEEEAAVYPVVSRLMGGEDPMGTMARAHLEIDHLSRVFVHLVDDVPTEGPAAEDLVDLRRVLYGLHAILRLHFAQEEEAYSWLASEALESEEAAVG